MRVDWTDDRLEERFNAIDQRFDAVDQRLDGIDRRFDRAEGEIQRLRGDMDRGFEKADVNLRLFAAEVNGRFDSLQRSLFLSASGIVAALIGVIITQL